MQTYPLQGNRRASGKPESVLEVLSKFEKVEFVAKLGTASLPLTYVSGYLIATSYLGTFGLHPDASDFFRTKYIYVGFLYLIFLALMASIAWLVIQTVPAILLIMGSATEPGDKDELALAREELNNRKKSRRARLRELRWHLVVTLILFVFSFEIMFLNPGNKGWYLPSQLIFLFGVVLFQCSFYAEARNPYTWGLVHGRTYVEYSRWTLFFSQAAMVACMVVIAWRSTKMNTYYPPILHHLDILKFIRRLSIALQILAACSLFSRTMRLKEVDDHLWSWWKPGTSEGELIFKRVAIKSFQILTSFVGCFCGYFFVNKQGNKRIPSWIWRAVILFPLIAFALWPIYWRGVFFSGHPKTASSLLGGTALLLSLAVLANVLSLIFMFGVRSRILRRLAPP